MTVFILPPFSAPALKKKKNDINLIFQMWAPGPRPLMDIVLAFAAAPDKLQVSNASQGLFSIPDPMCFEKY